MLLNEGHGIVRHMIIIQRCNSSYCDNRNMVLLVLQMLVATMLVTKISQNDGGGNGGSIWWMSVMECKLLMYGVHRPWLA